MILVGFKISFIIFNSDSLKDKRSIVKSIIQKMHRKYNISISEVDDNDIINKGVIGIGIVSNNYVLCKQIVENVVKDIESQYEIEINNIQEY